MGNKIKRAYEIKIPNENELIKQNIGLVHYVIKRYFSNLKNLRIVDYNDLVQIGSIGLLSGLRYYNYDKNGDYDTYLIYSIKSEFIKFIRHINRYKRVINLKTNSFEDYLSTSNKENRFNYLANLIPDNNVENEYKKIENKIYYKQIIEKSKLSKREYQIINLLINGFTQKQISNKIQLSESKVCEYKQNAIKKIKTYLKAIKEIC